MNTIQYKGYTGSIEISIEDNCLYGKVLFVDSLISYEGQSIDELKKDFQDSIDDYIELCQAKGWTPQKPFKGSFNVRLSPSVHRNLAIQARQRKLSLNKYVSQILEKSVD